jgi:octaprenyl-diphosphate synthase
MKSILSMPAINAKQVFDLLRDDLAAIEREFGRDTASKVGVITEIGEYLRGSGGKRIRPVLLLLSAKLLGYSGRSSIQLGAVVEIIHTATLVHDDIIDEAQTRRGQAAANVRWGNSKCVLAGDWLYMQAFKTALGERNFRILDVLIELTQMMVEGELMQIESLGRRIGKHEHLELIERKTACLFSVCTRLGGIIAGATPEQEEKLAAYGRNLGMAFQLVDDLLDLTASEEKLGKPVGSDLREGKVTLSVIHALERCTPQEAQKIDTVLEERAFRSVTHQEITMLLERYGSVKAAMDQAVQFAGQARDSICSFPDSDVKRALLWAPEFVVEREK